MASRVLTTSSFSSSHVSTSLWPKVSSLDIIGHRVVSLRHLGLHPRPKCVALTRHLRPPHVGGACRKIQDSEMYCAASKYLPGAMRAGRLPTA